MAHARQHGAETAVNRNDDQCDATTKRGATPGHAHESDLKDETEASIAGEFEQSWNDWVELDGYASSAQSRRP